MNTLEIQTPTQGNVDHAGDVIISSEYSGTLYCEGKLTIQSNASVNGEFHTQTAYVFGSLKGFLEVQKHVIFTDGSKFEGILDAPSMVCSLGTTLIGDIRVKPMTKG